MTLFPFVSVAVDERDRASPVKSELESVIVAVVVAICVWWFFANIVIITSLVLSYHRRREARSAPCPPSSSEPQLASFQKDRVDPRS